MPCLSDIDVVLLAGGKGTRLRAAVADRPKVLAPINGQPFLWHCLRWLGRFGARRVILSLGYKAAAVETYLRSESFPGMNILPHVESTPLGTGGAVRDVLPLIGSPAALVLNGDSVTRLNLAQFVEFHRGKKALLSMLLTRRPDASQSGLVETDAEDRVISFREKQSDVAGGYINAGVYLMQRDVISDIPANQCVSIEKEVFPRWCGREFYGLKGEFPFIDIGTPESFRMAGEFFRELTA